MGSNWNYDGTDWTHGTNGYVHYDNIGDNNIDTIGKQRLDFVLANFG
jgi:hypothetical protein